MPGHNRTWANYSECVKFLTNETRERVGAFPGPSLTRIKQLTLLVTSDLLLTPPATLTWPLPLNLMFTPRPRVLTGSPHLRRRCLTAWA